MISIFSESLHVAGGQGLSGQGTSGGQYSASEMEGCQGPEFEREERPVMEDLLI